MSYPICIPCAGTGSRLGSLTKYLNKGLISVANRPILSHLIDQFPQDAEFVIALGHKGQLVRDFLSLAYPNRRIFFQEVFPFEGAGSGLGLSLLTCKRYLQQPFVFISCDTIVEETIPAPDHNWMGYAITNDLHAYRTIAISHKGVSSIAEKGEGSAPEHKAYIGLAGINNYQEFWGAMEQGSDSAIATGEAHGMRGLLQKNIQAYRFTWHDTGNPSALSQTKERYLKVDQPNILEKANESIWFVDNAVIKFSADKNFIANRVIRAKQLQGFVPEITGTKDNMYSYRKVRGEILSDVITIPMFDRLLDHCVSFWEESVLTAAERTAFKECCMKFYRDKTLERVTLFYSTFNHKDGREPINGNEMIDLSTMLSSVDWDWLADGLPGRFHGDFHFENILWDDLNHKYVFLDWRQEFGGNISTGDIYYDFAKLLHGLIINHEIIARNHFRIDWNVDAINYDFHRKQALVECEDYFGSWLEHNGYDRRKVVVLTSLVFLNIAALHHDPYSLLLYALGKDMLARELE